MNRLGFGLGWEIHAAQDVLEARNGGNPWIECRDSQVEESVVGRRAVLEHPGAGRLVGGDRL